ncbi:MAG TPA: hypothetical protein VIX12_02640 [Candidatus Binataceae bacterium]
MKVHSSLWLVPVVLAGSALGGGVSNYLFHSTASASINVENSVKAERFLLVDKKTGNPSAALLPEADLYADSHEPQAPNLILIDPEGHIRARLGLHTDGAHLEFYSAAGSRTWFATGGGAQPLAAK